MPAQALSAEQLRLQFVTLVDPVERPSLFQLFEKTNNEICRRLQYTCTLRFFPPARAAAMVESGEADGENYRIFNFATDGQNPRHLRIDAPLFPASFVAWGKPGSARVNSWDELAAQGQPVIHLFGSKTVTSKLSAKMGSNLLPTHSVESGLNMVLADRAGYFITSDSRGVEQKISQMRLEGQLARLGMVDTVDTYMYLNDKHRAIAPRFKRTIEDMKKDGTLEMLMIEAGEIKARQK
ncbi:substrate-binding periplasmic protein [Undibacterium sp. TJN25]|uniref:substrate-binding periplasmic protein n=1 Tax=Undibacterium sp. TJN25 TaxID=3413056 RepID=UPI003BF345D8